MLLTSRKPLPPVLKRVPSPQSFEQRASARPLMRGLDEGAVEEHARLLRRVRTPRMQTPRVEHTHVAGPQLSAPRRPAFKQRSDARFPLCFLRVLLILLVPEIERQLEVLVCKERCVRFLCVRRRQEDRRPHRRVHVLQSTERRENRHALVGAFSRHNWRVGVHGLPLRARKRDQRPELVKQSIFSQAVRNDVLERAEQGRERGAHRRSLQAEFDVVAVRSAQDVAKSSLPLFTELFVILRLSEGILKRIVDRRQQLRRHTTRDGAVDAHDAICFERSRSIHSATTCTLRR
mmetsp:Transcript_2868/g.6612  ORF Transcript_2868/g.6612 Transcript_2868/m.6612 type:complete len:291 (-) Transcript_2868:586-1458(-)